MTAFLITFLIFALALRYGLPLLVRWVLRRVVRQAATGFGGGASRAGGAGGAGGWTPADERSTPTGRVRVAYVPPRPKREPRPGGYVGGEYVEFEEVR